MRTRRECTRGRVQSGIPVKKDTAVKDLKTLIGVLIGSKKTAGGHQARKEVVEST